MTLPSPTRLRVLAATLLLTGVVFITLSVQLTPKTPLQDFQAMPQVTPEERKSLPARIDIGGLIDLPVMLSQYSPQGWQVASQAASLASTSAYPGEHGNIVIFSHNYRRLFGKLDQIKIGSRVEIRTADGAMHEYTVVTREIVNPDQVESLAPSTTEILTLYTCTGLFDSKRLVVRALPISP